MNKNAWIVAVVVALVFGGGGYYFGKQSATSATPTGAAAYAGRTGATGRTGSSTGNGTLTIQMAASTSTTATTGTKIVLFDTSTMVNELESVPASTLAVGQSIVVTGTANSDGSVTATSIQVRPAGMGSRTGAVPTATQ
jgi:hypothetical protein